MFVMVLGMNAPCCIEMKEPLNLVNILEADEKPRAQRWKKGESKMESLGPEWNVMQQPWSRPDELLSSPD
jgi:hypothetical protein